jgi:hypothetical protein
MKRGQLGSTLRSYKAYAQQSGETCRVATKLGAAVKSVIK